MDVKLRLVLLQSYLIVVAKGEETTAETYFRVDCGQYELDPFYFFCHNGVKKRCDFSHCQEAVTEDSRKKCALFCGQVLQKLQQLPRKVAALKKMQSELATSQQSLNEQYHMVTGLQTENSKLLNLTKFQNITINGYTKTIISQHEQNKKLKTFIAVIIILIIVIGIILVIVILKYSPLDCVRNKLCKRKPKDSGKDEEQPLVILPDIQTNTRSKMGDESTVDSAFGTASSGVTQPTDEDQQKHRCDVLNKVKPTDDNDEAPVVTSAADSLADTTIDMAHVVEESSWRRLKRQNCD